VRLLDVYTRKLLGLKYELVCHFELVVDSVGGGVRTFVNDVDRSTFLEN
jgi:hypothetical protein